MKFLKSERACKRWAKSNGQREPLNKPLVFPCWGWDHCTSYAYEESEGRFLYLTDLERMAALIRRKQAREVVA